MKPNTPTFLSHSAFHFLFGLALLLPLQASRDAYAGGRNHPRIPSAPARPQGGDTPVPISDGAVKVELADGEKYRLVGTLLISNGTVFFEPDFDEQPWLYNNKRQRSPYYRVETADRTFYGLHNRRVKLTAVAHSAIVTSTEQNDPPAPPAIEISLLPEGAPEALRNSSEP